MHLREATYADVPAMGDISFAAFKNAPIYMHFSPHHFTYPESWRAFLVNEIKMRMVSPGQVVVVAETDVPVEGDEGRVTGTTKKVVGVACWIRRGNPHDVAQWKPDSLFRRAERVLLSLESIYVSYFDNTTCLESIRNFHGQASTLIEQQHLFNRLELNTLAVSPDHQRQGIGALLINWGIHKAKEERIPIILEATSSGLPLYTLKGFKIFGNIVLPARVIPKNGRKGLDCLKIEELVTPFMKLA